MQAISLHNQTLTIPPVNVTFLQQNQNYSLNIISKCKAISSIAAKYIF